MMSPWLKTDSAVQSYSFETIMMFDIIIKTLHGKKTCIRKPPFECELCGNTMNFTTNSKGHLTKKH